MKAFELPGGTFSPDEIREMFADPHVRASLCRITGIDRGKLDAFVESASGDAGRVSPQVEAPPAPASGEQAFEAAYRAYVDATGGDAPSLTREFAGHSDEEAAELRARAAWAPGSESEWRRWEPWL